MSQREKLNKCMGSYVIRCSEITDGWDNCDSLSIDIAAGTKAGILEAAVKFGIIESTMLLAFNQDDFDACMASGNEEDENDKYVYDEDYGVYRKRQAAMASDESENDTYSYDEDDAVYRKRNTYEDDYGLHRKRKATANTTALKSGSGRQKKQIKLGMDTSNRLFFRLRGRETGEGQIFFDANQGYLDFTDSGFVVFKGVGAPEHVGNRVPFEGFKLSKEAAVEAEPWSRFFGICVGRGKSFPVALRCAGVASGRKILI
jgi:hypothetical protein